MRAQKDNWEYQEMMSWFNHDREEPIHRPFSEREFAFGLETIRRARKELGNGPRYVAVVLEDRAFGGREEGGWWYPYGMVINQIWTTPNSPRFQRKQAWVNEENEGRPDISSVLSEGRYTLMQDNVPVRDYPEYIPRYE